MKSEAIVDSSARPVPEGLLVVTVDRLPAWMLPAFGATWVAMPSIDALAARGIVFDRVITPTLDPNETLRELTEPAAPCGPSWLRSATTRGWAAALVTDDTSTAARFGAAGGFDVELVPAARAGASAVDDGATQLARLVAATIDVVRAGRHRLVWCHAASLGVLWDAPRHYRDRYVDPEDPPPPPGAAVPSFAVDATTDPDRIVAARQVFAGQLSLLDAEIGRLIAAVPTRGDREAGWGVMLAGIRGMPLGLHGWVGVGGPEEPFGELVHVPAILVDAAGRMAGQRYGGLVMPADLGITLAALVSGDGSLPHAIDPAAPWRGASLAGLFEDWSAAPRDRVVVGGRDAAAIVTPSWHGVFRRAAGQAAGADDLRLFAKPDDFFELTDVADRCPAVTESLSALHRRAADDDGRSLWCEDLPETTPG